MAIESAKQVPQPDPHRIPSDPAYLKIRDLIYRTSGIYYADEKLYLLSSRCANRMGVIGTESPHEYLRHLTTGKDRDAELRLLLNEITIGETYMFRHPSQLEALRSVIFQEIVNVKGSLGLKRLRVWSAGCSTGEEPYTLAIFLLEESSKLLPGWTLDILATDLNDSSLETARAGIYGDYALRNTSEALRKKYFKVYDRTRLQASEQLKSLIRFERINLTDDSKMSLQQGLDVIFCCNVLIYFDLESKRRVVRHFYSSLASGGYLFLGHAESLFHVDESFRLVHFPKTTAYRKAPVAGVQP
jgi:chemotaxis protein methyltransferase CheR